MSDCDSKKSFGLRSLIKRLLIDHTMYVVVPVFVIGGILMFWYLRTLEKKLINSSVLESAALYTQALSEFRTLYTADVVKAVKEAGIEVTHDYEKKSKAIPLPATLSMKLGERIGDHQNGAESRLFSPYPFPWRGEIGKFRDSFSKDAWNNLVRNPKKPFYRFESYKGRMSLRYAVADTMRTSCVDCHNSHNETPKNDWKEGDVRGVLEVIHPIDTIIASTKKEMEGMFFLVLFLTGFFLCGLVLIIRRLRRDAEKLEIAQDDLESIVDQRTVQLRKIFFDLEKEVDQKEKVQMELMQAEKMASVGQMAGGIAHEINTPVQYVGDNLNFLSEEQESMLTLIQKYQEGIDGLDEDEAGKVTDLKKLKDEIDLEFLLEEVPSAIQQSLDGIGQVARLVRSMKEFAHPGNDEMKLIDVNRAIQNVVTVSRNEWKYVAEIKLDFNEKLPAVPCFYGEFNQVLLNILVNAAHAIEEKNDENNLGLITLKTDFNEEEVMVSISDTGTGMTDEVKNKAFDVFFTTKEVGKGTGQGLAIAYNLIVEKLKGSLSIETELGSGSTFVVKLPRNNGGEKE